MLNKMTVKDSGIYIDCYSVGQGVQSEFCWEISCNGYGKRMANGREGNRSDAMKAARAARKEIVSTSTTKWWVKNA